MRRKLLVAAFVIVAGASPAWACRDHNRTQPPAVEPQYNPQAPVEQYIYAESGQNSLRLAGAGLGGIVLATSAVVALSKRI